jgi:hypothetical protein
MAETIERGAQQRAAIAKRWGDPAQKAAASKRMKIRMAAASAVQQEKGTNKMNKVVINPAATIAKIATMTDLAQIQRVRANAMKRGETAVAKAALEREAALRASLAASPIVGAYEATMYVYEQIVLNGGYAGRTRPMVSDRMDQGMTEEEAVKDTFISLIKSKKPQTGFTSLAEQGLVKLTFEFVVARQFPNEFPAENVAIAEKRLENYL